MQKPEAVDVRPTTPEGEQIITSQGIIARANQLLYSREIHVDLRQMEDESEYGKYTIDEQQATFHGFPAVTFREHLRNRIKSPNDPLGILQEWKIFGKTSEGRVSLELTLFEEKEPSISVVNQDERTRRDLSEISSSEQEEIARVMKISS